MVSTTITNERPEEVSGIGRKIPALRQLRLNRLEDAATEANRALLDEAGAILRERDELANRCDAQALEIAQLKRDLASLRRAA